jgi:hypothetical protein
MGRLIGHDTKGLPMTFTALDGVLCLLESAWRLCEAILLPMCVMETPEVTLVIQQVLLLVVHQLCCLLVPQHLQLACPW